MIAENYSPEVFFVGNLAVSKANIRWASPFARLT